MFMWSVLTALRTLRKVKPVLEAVADPGVEEILRNGMAYAYEIGKGEPMVPELMARLDNPFLNPDWREAMYK